MKWPKEQITSSLALMDEDGDGPYPACALSLSLPRACTLQQLLHYNTRGGQVIARLRLSLSLATTVKLPTCPRLVRAELVLVLAAAVGLVPTSAVVCRVAESRVCYRSRQDGARA